MSTELLRHERYWLRSWREDDAGWYLAARDEDVFRWTIECPELDAAGFVADHVEENDLDRAHFALVENGALVGSVAAVRTDGVAELSYWVAPGARGRGAASAGLAMLCNWAADHWDVHRLELQIHPENAGSIRVAEKGGFVNAGLRESCASCAGPDGTVAVFSRDVPPG